MVRTLLPLAAALALGLPAPAQGLLFIRNDSGSAWTVLAATPGHTEVRPPAGARWRPLGAPAGRDPVLMPGQCWGFRSLPDPSGQPRDLHLLLVDLAGNRAGPAAAGLDRTVAGLGLRVDGATQALASSDSRAFARICRFQPDPNLVTLAAVGLPRPPADPAATKTAGGRRLPAAGDPGALAGTRAADAPGRRVVRLPRLAPAPAGTAIPAAATARPARSLPPQVAAPARTGAALPALAAAPARSGAAFRHQDPAPAGPVPAPRAQAILPARPDTLPPAPAAAPARVAAPFPGQALPPDRPATGIAPDPAGPSQDGPRPTPAEPAPDAALPVSPDGPRRDRPWAWPSVRIHNRQGPRRVLVFPRLDRALELRTRSLATGLSATTILAPGLGRHHDLPPGTVTKCFLRDGWPADGIAFELHGPGLRAPMLWRPPAGPGTGASSLESAVDAALPPEVRLTGTRVDLGAGRTFRWHQPAPPPTGREPMALPGRTVPDPAAALPPLPAPALTPA